MVVVSERAQVRLDAARAWLAERAPTEPCLVIGATIEAAHQLVRSRLETTGVLFGTHRLTLGALTSILAGPELAKNGEAVLSGLSTLAVVTRVVHHRKGRLGRFEPVGDRAGLPRALAETFHDLRLAAIDPDSLGASDPDLAGLYAAYLQALRELKLADDARILEAATSASSPLLGIPTLFLDVAVHTLRERRFVESLRDRAPQFLATAPAGDDRTIEALGGATSTASDATTLLAHVQRGLFSSIQAPPPNDDGSVTLVSAPGEGRECTEVVRELLRHARAGVPFDRMAIVLHDPAPYRARLSEVLRRSRVPAAFAEGTRVPDPAGRAFLALLACRADGLSAQRFAEYLSLGEVPEADLDGAPPPATRTTVPPADERMAARLPAPVQLSLFERPVASVPESDRPVIDGMLKVPRQWERLIVDAAVIGGLDRWRRRLDGLEHRLALERDRAIADDKPTVAGLDENIRFLHSLRHFAMPLLQDLADLPHEATWGVWIDTLSDLASRAIREPERIQQTLAELAPMAGVGPVNLGQVRVVLERRLTELLRPPPRRAEGSVFVGRPAQVRGRAFDVVAVLGLAEKVFPQKILEDTILIDARRRELSPDLPTDDDRVRNERLALRLAVGAATRSLLASYPRLDAARERPRVPSFYCLELMSLAQGSFPELEALVRDSAARAGASTIGWPAPRAAADAIDDAEYDLVVVERLVQAADRGSGRYLLQVNDHLRRALRARYARRQMSKWTPSDGLRDLGGEALAALARHRLDRRALSPSGLQSYAECPYRFYLQTILKLAPWEVPDAIDRIPPAERGTLIHEVLFRFLRTMREQARLPIRPANVPSAATELDRILDEVAARFEDDLAPAIRRVWLDELALVRSDLRLWLEKQSEEGTWVPWRFELAFGLAHGDERDPESVPDPVPLDAGIRLRGSVDLVERSADGRVRVTDFKTGRAHERTQRPLVVNGGRTLQPVLYALALEKIVPQAQVAGGRLYYCTTRAGFQERWVPLEEPAREAARVLAIAVDGAVESGDLVAAPMPGACRFCDCRAVCGSHEEARTKRKQKHLGEALADLRDLP
jgi:ATP-dependent helicase/nuclease subunit B